MTTNAFLIICHKNVRQVCELIKTILEQKNNHCFVFCDLNFSLQGEFIHFSVFKDRITIIQSDFKIEWGRFSIVSASLKLLEKAYNLNFSFKYFHLISGQDFPLKSSQEINFFFEDNDRIYIDFFLLPRRDGDWGVDGGFSRYIYNNVNRHQIPSNIRFLYGGSQWWSLTRESVTYILNYLKTNPSYVKFYYQTFIPDESFYQTILLNSKELKEKIVNDNLRYIDWKSGPTYPKILVTEDFEKIISSGCLFGRKFNLTEDNNIIELLKVRNRCI